MCFAQCHSMVKGAHNTGPSLHGVMGRGAGQTAGFAYSTAMKGAGTVGPHSRYFPLSHRACNRLCRKERCLWQWRPEQRPRSLFSSAVVLFVRVRLLSAYVVFPFGCSVECL